MKHLYYCRHGLSVMNEQGLLAGSTDTPLSENGRKQAAKAAETAKNLHIDLIVSSPLSRAHETATIIAREIGYPQEKIIVDDRTRERDFGDMEGIAWHLNIHFDYNDTVESYESIMARAAAVKDWLDDRPEETILLVSHGAFIRAIRSLYQPDMPYINATGQTANAEITRIV